MRTMKNEIAITATDKGPVAVIVYADFLLFSPAKYSLNFLGSGNPKWFTFSKMLMTSFA